MNILLDTHFILWVLADSQRLNSAERAALLDRDNNVYCSSISFFEISLKFSLGKLRLQGVQPDQLPGLMKSAGFLIQESDADIYASFYQLERGEHKDPFDRLLIWQAIQNDFVLMSRDRSFSRYASAGLKLF
ncbi:type II toxin-antitoxin system VapC family toxin [Persicirhabdus sediminis]|uniref:Type II toxin-antitoxin system VapC family toxin n=1 Tax=Persicirhabdus sediminis TaxID=454144 RepID=A0A8J7MHA4_9BACT|nr:type II toxin-antitoxin system VapC family toxin [Persicirhabdus sediminis]MBK1792856.1 type II toxin-antitoxin system VapC family toxin [Persicirhabdus sediminis]